MLLPKKVKHRKWNKGAGRPKGNATRGTKLSFGSMGLKAITGNYLTSRQIEAARRAMTRHIHRGGKVWIRVFPDKPITKKGAEVGMGGGKGSVDHFALIVAPGLIIFEIDGVSKELAKEALRRAGHKLPFKTKVISSE